MTPQLDCFPHHIIQCLLVVGTVFIELTPGKCVVQSSNSYAVRTSSVGLTPTVVYTPQSSVGLTLNTVRGVYSGRVVLHVCTSSVGLTLNTVRGVYSGRVVLHVCTSSVGLTLNTVRGVYSGRVVLHVCTAGMSCPIL